MTRYRGQAMITGFCLVFGSAAVASQSGWRTGDELLAACGTEPNNSRPSTWDTGICMGYITGIAEVLVGAVLICPSPTSTKGQIIVVVIKSLVAHPVLRAHEALLLVGDALKEAFPCPK